MADFMEDATDSVGENGDGKPLVSPGQELDDNMDIDEDADDGSTHVTISRVTLTPKGWVRIREFSTSFDAAIFQAQIDAPDNDPLPIDANLNMKPYKSYAWSDNPPPSKPDRNLYFRDCGGLEKQIKFLQTAVLKPITSYGSPNNPLKRFDLKPPKGVLFYGPPGTGKTRLAMALGNELTRSFGTQVHFIYRKGQDVASKYFGQSSKNLREIFAEAIQMKPTILFFDELDGLCPSRDKPAMNQSNITIVTTLLGLMDDLPLGQVFVIGATNRLEGVDPAMRRPGRFDKHLQFSPPSTSGRLDILNIHTKSWKVKPEEQLLKRMSEKTSGFSGADLYKLCHDAFDYCMKKYLEKNEARRLPYIDFSGLSVKEEDWNAALGQMAPTKSNVFGSTLYTPEQSLAECIQPLTKRNVQELLAKLLQTKIGKNPAESIISSFYVWSDLPCTGGCMEEYILSQVLTSPQLGSVPVYCLSPEKLSAFPAKEWPTRINDTFNQATGTGGSAILYLKNVDELWNMIKSHRVTLAVNLGKQLERLRGPSVFLLASGSTKPASFPGDHPFKEVLMDSKNRSYQIEPPKEDARESFFTPLFSTAVLGSETEWVMPDLRYLVDTLQNAVDCTEEKDMCHNVLLYDLLERCINAKVQENKIANHTLLIKELMKVVLDFKNMVDPLYV